VLVAPKQDYTRALLAAVPKGRLSTTVRPIGPPVLEAKGMTKRYAQPFRLFDQRPAFTALDNVSLSIGSGEILGVVGESGSGKSTAARCIARLMPPDEGTLLLHGSDYGKMASAASRHARRQVQMIFQDPYSSLNPRRRVGELLIQGPLNFGIERSVAERKAREMLSLVGLDASAFERFPGAFSGGQRQRICIARALMPEPDLLIADEAVSALDVSVQAQILELLRSIRQRLDLAILFITHDMRVAAELCDRLIVMRGGRIVDQGTCRQVLLESRNDYTRQLIEAIPGERKLFRDAGT
jgi:peptide/nickel transport system ATP-binding protein